MPKDVSLYHLVSLNEKQTAVILILDSNYELKITYLLFRSTSLYISTQNDIHCVHSNVKEILLNLYEMLENEFVFLQQHCIFDGNCYLFKLKIISDQKSRHLSSYEYCIAEFRVAKLDPMLS